MAQVPVLLSSWRANATRWTRAVRTGAIASRRAGTDQAIIEAVLSRRPRRVLDAGCGEGWLVRALAQRGVEEVGGFDAVPELIAAARELPSPRCRFWVESFEDNGCAGDEQADGSYDVAVLNFAIFDEDPAPLFAKLARLLSPKGGAIVIQTLHPGSDATGIEGWRTESFSSMRNPEDDGPWHPMPWYFRTLDSWRAAASRAGLVVESVTEPAHRETGLPLSLVLTLVVG